MKLKSLVVTSAALSAALLSAVLLSGTPASAGWFDAIQGNDTGGIMPWAPNLHETLEFTASTHCATYHKLALVTSLPHQPGDYAAFVCVFPRDYDPVRARANQWR